MGYSRFWLKMADVESNSIPHELHSSHWLKATGQCVLERYLSATMGFTIYGHGGHFGHVTWTIYTNLHSPFPRRLHIKVGFDWPRSFRGEDV